nr:hypothetical protein CFP56_04267 [Quercus suber]
MFNTHRTGPAVEDDAFDHNWQNELAFKRWVPGECQRSSRYQRARSRGGTRVGDDILGQGGVRWTHADSPTVVQVGFRDLLKRFSRGAFAEEMKMKSRAIAAIAVFRRLPGRYTVQMKKRRPRPPNALETITGR